MLRRIYSFTKENLSLITVVPLILGGLWQAIELSLISPSYIRFFSVSQQVADGLLILSVLIILYSVYDTIKDMLLEKHDVYERAKNSYIDLIGSLLFYVFICLFTTLNISFLIEQYKFLDTDFYTIVKFTISAGFLIGFIYQIGVVIFSVTIKIFQIKKQEPILITQEQIEETKKYDFVIKPIFYITATSIFLFIIIYTIELVGSFHKSFNLPKNLKNQDYVISKYCIENNVANKDSVQIVYINDKYIFIEDSSKISIVKFDYMFKDNK